MKRNYYFNCLNILVNVSLESELVQVNHLGTFILESDCFKFNKKNGGNYYVSLFIYWI